jgi:hypothetical protein
VPVPVDEACRESTNARWIEGKYDWLSFYWRAVLVALPETRPGRHSIEYVVHQTADERVRQGGVDRFEGVLVRPFQQQAFIQLTRCESLKNRVGRKDPFVKCLWREAPSGYCQSQGTEDHALRIGRGFLETATEFCCESTPVRAMWLSRATAWP